VFSLQGELDAKLDQIAGIEADLAATEGVASATPGRRPEFECGMSDRKPLLK
jgi:hypothetical protein